jgi:hypothetical protein
MDDREQLQRIHQRFNENYWQRTSRDDKLSHCIMFVLFPLAIVYRFLQLNTNIGQIDERSQRLIDGHSLCVPYESTETGLGHRN